MEEQVKHYLDRLTYETDSWDLKVALEAKENVIVIDARSPQAHAAEHIPGSINIPHRQMSPETTAHLDRSALVVTYCDGTGCNASTKGALAMTRLGFRVKELMGGLDWWKRDGHATSAASPVDAGAPASCGCAPPVEASDAGNDTKAVAAYVVGYITIKDPTKWAEYRGKVPGTLAPWGAELILRGKRLAILAGEHAHADTVVIRFPDADAVANWFHSPAYQALIPLRTQAADMVLVSYASAP